MHLLIGFMLDPRGQLKSLENSGLLIAAPITRLSYGACVSFIIGYKSRKNDLEAHHVFAKDNQNS